MNLLQAIGESYKRWRHSKGYGVHSPFAYSIVKMAVRPGNGYAYYGYHDIDSALARMKRGEGYGALWKDARLALRLAATLRSRRLVVDCVGEEVWKSVGKALAVPVLTPRGGKMPKGMPGDLWIVRDTGSTRGAVARQGVTTGLLAAGAAVMAINPPQEARDELEAFSGNGLLLTGTRLILAIPNPDMHFAAYTMRF